MNKGIGSKFRLSIVVAAAIFAAFAMFGLYRQARADAGEFPTLTPTVTITFLPTETPTEVIFFPSETPVFAIAETPTEVGRSYPAPDFLTADDILATPTPIPDGGSSGSQLLLLGFLFVGAVLLIGIAAFALISRSRAAGTGP